MGYLPATTTQFIIACVFSPLLIIFIPAYSLFEKIINNIKICANSTVEGTNDSNGTPSSIDYDIDESWKGQNNNLFIEMILFATVVISVLYTPWSTAVLALSSYCSRLRKSAVSVAKESRRVGNSFHLLKYEKASELQDVEDCEGHVGVYEMAIRYAFAVERSIWKNKATFVEAILSTTRAILLFVTAIIGSIIIPLEISGGLNIAALIVVILEAKLDLPNLNSPARWIFLGLSIALGISKLLLMWYSTGKTGLVILDQIGSRFVSIDGDEEEKIEFLTRMSKSARWNVQDAVTCGTNRFSSDLSVTRSATYVASNVHGKIELNVHYGPEPTSKINTAHESIPIDQLHETSPTTRRASV